VGLGLGFVGTGLVEHPAETVVAVAEIVVVVFVEIAVAVAEIVAVVSVGIVVVVAEIVVAVPVGIAVVAAAGIVAVAFAEIAALVVVVKHVETLV